MMPHSLVLGIFGAGGLGREVLPFARNYLASEFSHFGTEGVKLVFVETDPSTDVINGYDVISEADFCKLECKEKYFNIAIGSSAARSAISENLSANGCRPMSLFARSSITYDNNSIGEGATICDNVMITSNARIGRFFQANIYSYVAHDCEIGDFVTFAPRVSCNGNVKICDHAYIGTGAIIKQGTKENPTVVGEGAVVGMGAVVTKSVSPHVTVVGNPARQFKR